MQRLKERYRDSETLHILANQESELLLLLDNRHVKHEKDFLCYLSDQLPETNKEELTERDVVSHVFPTYPYLYSEDIANIEEMENEYIVHIHPHCPIHYGYFKIKKG